MGTTKAKGNQATVSRPFLAAATPDAAAAAAAAGAASLVSLNDKYVGLLQWSCWCA